MLFNIVASHTASARYFIQLLSKRFLCAFVSMWFNKINMQVWQFIQDKLNASLQVMLLYVLQSEGSSPGRQGFKMAVAVDGSFCGTIGGGIMEFKLVEKAKMLLQKNETEVLLIWQHHDKLHSEQSGMICSGNQLNAFVPLGFNQLHTINSILQSIKNNSQQIIKLSPLGIALVQDSKKENWQGFQQISKDNWWYGEWTNQQPIIHIIGGGHVGLALSEMMRFLNFYVHLYDDRDSLNTIQDNHFANEKHIINYEKIGENFNNCEQDFVVIMTVGYRTDKLVLQQLLDKNYAYLGMLGSANKIKQLFEELTAEGISVEKLSKIFTPVGLNIYSKTTKEIAVSIAAEIIREKNIGLPTGR